MDRSDFARGIEDLYSALIPHEEKKEEQTEAATSMLDFISAGIQERKRKREEKAAPTPAHKKRFQIPPPNQRVFIPFGKLNTEERSKVPRPQRQAFMDRLSGFLLQYTDKQPLIEEEQTVLVQFEEWIHHECRHEMDYREHAVEWIRKLRLVDTKKKTLSLMQLHIQACSHVPLPLDLQRRYTPKERTEESISIDELRQDIDIVLSLMLQDIIARYPQYPLSAASRSEVTAKVIAKVTERHIQSTPRRHWNRVADTLIKYEFDSIDKLVFRYVQQYSSKVDPTSEP